jgi:hypothetical protein
MDKKEKPSTHDETDSVESGKTTSQPGLSLARESLELKISEEQRRTSASGPKSDTLPIAPISRGRFWRAIWKSMTK